MLHGCPPSPDAWGRLNVVTPFHHLSGHSHINSSLREGPLRHLVSTACPASRLALIEIGEALSAGLRTLARVFGRALRIAGPITFVPFTCVGSSDRRERHS